MATSAIDLLQRLDSDLRAAGKAIDGISNVVSPYNPATVVVSPTNQQSACQSIINAFDGSDAAQAAWLELQRQAAAKTMMTDPQVYPKSYRAVAGVLVDELNSIRQWIVSFKVQVAAATTLADLKTRVATLPDLPDRTLAQAKTAFNAKIDAGV